MYLCNVASTVGRLILYLPCITNVSASGGRWPNFYRYIISWQLLSILSSHLILLLLPELCFPLYVTPKVKLTSQSCGWLVMLFGDLPDNCDDRTVNFLNGGLSVVLRSCPD